MVPDPATSQPAVVPPDDRGLLVQLFYRFIAQPIDRFMCRWFGRHWQTTFAGLGTAAGLMLTQIAAQPNQIEGLAQPFPEHIRAPIIWIGRTLTSISIFWLGLKATVNRFQALLPPPPPPTPPTP